METVFLDMLNISITASYLVLAVLLLRPLLKKAPKALTAGLWALVGIRLLLPFSIESVFSLIPSAETVPAEILTSETPMIHSGISFVNSAVNPVISQSLAPQESVSPVLTLTQIAGVVWLVGMGLMLLYSAISYGRLHFRVRVHLQYRDNIYFCDQIDSPFILGIFRPRIYLPSDITPEQMDYVLAHENAHLRRKDHWWKPLGFLLLSIHWFNPLMWAAYILLCRDIELACDEKVIRAMDATDKKGYSEALVACSLQRRLVMACPLAFGEVAVKDRIKSVFSYKKPTLWIILIAVVVCIALTVGFLTNPVSPGEVNEVLSVFLDVQVCNHHTSDNSSQYYCAADLEILGTEEKDGQTTVYLWVLYQEYSYEGGLQVKSSSHIPTVITAQKVEDHYQLVEYWEPRDGTYFAQDIRSKFPLRLQNQALDSQRYIADQQARLDARAEAHYNTQAGQVLEYQYLDSIDPLTPQLTLYPQQRFHFRYSGFSSYYPYGSYQLTDDRLILSTDDGSYTYVFEIKGDSYVFDADSSSPIPEYKYSGSSNITVSPVPDGAVFEKVTRTATPPSLMVTCGDHCTTAWTGGYNWQYKLSDGTVQGTTVDSSHPLSCLDTVPGLPLMPTAISAIDPHQTVLQFSQSPKSITVKRYSIDAMSIALGTAGYTEIDCTNNRFSMEYGTYLYEIIAKFDSADGSGTVHYAFYSATPTVESITQEEFGLTMEAVMGSGDQIHVTFTHNPQAATMSGNLSIGQWYQIQAYHDGQWLSLKSYMRDVLHYDYTSPQIFVFNDSTYMIHTGGTREITHDLSVHGILPPGNYRICKTVTLTKDTGEQIEKFYTAEFAIVD